MRSLRIPARAGAAALALTLTGSLAACTEDGDEGPDPRPAAEALAAALAAGDLEEVELGGPLAAEAPAAYTATVARLGEVEPEVTVEDVQADGSDGDRATATLAWRWPLAEEPWTYTTEVALERSGEDWVPLWAPTVVEGSLGEDELLDATTVTAARGDILGARGLALVTERPVLRLGVDRGRVSRAQAVASARRLAALVDIDAAAYAGRVRAAGELAFVEAITYRRDEVPVAVARAYPAIEGVLGIQDEQSLAPTREFAAPILGTVGPVTAEMLNEDPDRYRPGDIAGLSGLQARYDEQLRGTPGVVVAAVSDDPSGGDDERELFRADPVDGEDLALTLDLDLQTAAEAALADVGTASAVVVLRPSDGAILAAANGPGTDGYNVATYGQYAPGSTFKIASSLALLRAGLRPDSPVSCPPSVSVDGKRFENYSGYPAAALGRITLREAVAQSCNTAFIGARTRLEEDDLAAAAASVGLGVDHDLGFPAYFGSVDPAAGETEAAAALIGQGTVLASPMAMAAVIGSVQEGSLVVPRLLEDVEVGAPQDVDPLTGAEARQLRAMLRAVVTEGSGRLLADLPGPPVIAKTGTAEYGEAGEVRTHAWMVAAQGDVAAAVLVERGASGSGTAGPILRRILSAAR
ncbi:MULTISPECIES: penicillin-binding transpeptidase domain-containing protein [unclassified Nocardioides]|uniref:penicillin-binding transpeptidase domain-containing protein n=1 Tax=unclassified Nocardioides TaxID=2615069 RepID=UPI001E34F6EA|nr:MULTISPECIES: penicillin-binding transpeptidase domain-containing protein [unclassified Nocardioides]